MGAYLVQHLDPQRLQFAVATALLFLFCLMASPIAKVVRRARLRHERSLRRRLSSALCGAPSGAGGRGSFRKAGSLQEPLLPVVLEAGETACFPNAPV